MNDQNNYETENLQKNDSFWRAFSILVSIIMFLASLVFYIGSASQGGYGNKNNQKENAQTNQVASNIGFVLPVDWKGMGRKLIEAGVIDETSLENIYARRGGLNDSERVLINDGYSGELVINEQNAGYLLNLLWAFGLANKNPILEEGPMQNPSYGGAGRFASTGGWTLAVGNPMGHYSMHEFVKLTKEQQALVEEVSKNIYRPCCGNSTYFPDCNHGMAMLGFLELMAANGSSEEEMYRVALQVNALWFPDTYSAIDQYLKMNGDNLASANPKEILGAEYSSAYGYANILSQIQTPENRSNNGGGCSV